MKKPDEQGTVAHGFIVWQGKKYSYRQVRWDEKTAEEANIAANIGAGVWDWDVIANAWNVPELMEWGLNQDQLFELNRDANSLRDLMNSEGIELDMQTAWEGMPEYGDDAKAFKTIHIHFEKLEDMNEFENKYNFPIGDKITFWYPPHKKRNMIPLEFQNES